MATGKEKYDFKGSSLVMIASFMAVISLRLFEVIMWSWYIVVPVAIIAMVLVPAIISTIRFTKNDPASEEAEKRFTQIQQQLLEKASDQSFQLRIIKEEEALSIARMGDFSKKRHDSAEFIDVAIMLLCLPPELGFAVALEFSNFAHLVGFQPFGTIMVAVGNIDSLYSPMLVRKSLLDQKPELDSLLQSKKSRVEKAAKLLVAGLFISARDVADAKKMCKTMSMDSAVREVFIKEILKKDENLAQLIIS